ncbi:MAG: hypothetical protein AAGE43_04240 [Pseudomonadota bacterium]
MAIALRCLIVIFGGYALTSGLVALSGQALHELGLPLGESVLLVTMLGFLLYLAIIIWGFADPRLPRVVLFIGVGSLASIGLSSFLA